MATVSTPELSASFKSTLLHVYHAFPEKRRCVSPEAMLASVEGAYDRWSRCDVERKFDEEVHFFFERHGFEPDHHRWPDQGMTTIQYEMGRMMVAEVLVDRAMHYARANEKLYLDWLVPEWHRPKAGEPRIYIPSSFVPDVPIDTMLAKTTTVAVLSTGALEELVQRVDWPDGMSSENALKPLRDGLPRASRFALGPEPKWSVPRLVMQNGPEDYVAAAFDVNAGQLVPLADNDVCLSEYLPAACMALRTFSPFDGQHGRGRQGAAAFFYSIRTMPAEGVIEVGPVSGDSCTVHYPCRFWKPMETADGKEQG